MLTDEVFHLSELVPRESPIAFQFNGIEPKLGFVLVPSDVNVQRFVQYVIRVNKICAGQCVKQLAWGAIDGNKRSISLKRL